MRERVMCALETNREKREGFGMKKLVIALLCMAMLGLTACGLTECRDPDCDEKPYKDGYCKIHYAAKEIKDFFS